MDSRFADSFLATFARTRGRSAYTMLEDTPSKEVVTQIAHEFLELMFPGRRGDTLRGTTLRDKVTTELTLIRHLLISQIFLALKYAGEKGTDEETRARAEGHVDALYDALPSIRLMLKEDAAAGFAGDPAATSVGEVILSYPCMEAITIHRIAHVLYSRKVPIIPRMLGEVAHQETGIDIHPGATIGKSFFIDHGTGVVIGETSVIGDCVKLYQGVTLGALSFPKDASGALIRGLKRHPTIGNNVTIYSHATILGDITIGSNAIIGAGVWIREDVPDNTMVTRADPHTILRDLSRKKTRVSPLDFSQL